MPERIQRKRTKGWRMPPNTVSVTRPGKWGNPFRVVNDAGFWFVVDADGKYMNPHFYNKQNAVGASLFLYRTHADKLRDEIKKDLRGKNLSCFCKSTEPCHADILLEIANS